MTQAGRARPRLTSASGILFGLLIGSAVMPATADEACRRALAGRIKTCSDACIERAKAAVDPEIRDRIKGYGCINNCTKLEIFNGHVCPDDGK